MIKDRKRMILALALGAIIFLSGCGKKCCIVGCNNKVLDEQTECCEEHICGVKKCLNPKIDGSDYCEAHTCAVDGCYNRIKGNSEYCSEHICKKDSCPNRRTDESEYCSEHIYVCVRNSCDNRRVDGSEFCIEHKCALEGCSQERAEASIPSIHCRDHACFYMFERCDTPTIPSETYCSKHICSYPGCTNCKNPNSEYCPSHDNVQTELNLNKNISPFADTKIIDTDGKHIWQVYAKSSELHFTGSFHGSGYFGIKILDSNQDFFALVANEIGDYNVDKSVYGLIPNEMYYIQIECTEGSWTCSWTGTYGR